MSIRIDQTSDPAVHEPVATTTAAAEVDAGSSPAAAAVADDAKAANVAGPDDQTLVLRGDGDAAAPTSIEKPGLFFSLFALLQGFAAQVRARSEAQSKPKEHDEFVTVWVWRQIRVTYTVGAGDERTTCQGNPHWILVPKVVIEHVRG